MALHCKCLGEKNKPSELDNIRTLLNYDADFTVKNKKFQLPIHLAALMGRLDVLEVLHLSDKNNKIIRIIENESDEESTNSPTYLALVNDHLACAYCNYALISYKSNNFKDKFKY